MAAGWAGLGGGGWAGWLGGWGVGGWLGWAGWALEAALKLKLVYSKMAKLCPDRKYELSNGQQQQAISIYFFLEGLGFIEIVKGLGANKFWAKVLGETFWAKRFFFGTIFCIWGWALGRVEGLGWAGLGWPGLGAGLAWLVWLGWARAEGWGWGLGGLGAGGWGLGGVGLAGYLNIASICSRKRLDTMPHPNFCTEGARDGAPGAALFAA